MENPKFQPGDKVQHTKNKRTGFVKHQRGEGIFIVSVQGFGEREWKEDEMVKLDEPKNKFDPRQNKSAV
jgi:hypothetical protein